MGKMVFFRILTLAFHAYSMIGLKMAPQVQSPTLLEKATEI